MIVMCGLPKSGKSKVALELAEEIKKKTGKNVHITNEETLKMKRATAYANNPSEKNFRDALKASTERLLSKNSFVIVDSLNFIKGYRYELFTRARTAGVPHCVIYCDTPQEVCRERNAITKKDGEEEEEDAYPENVINDLFGRFEQPNSRNRWDSPLFTVLYRNNNSNGNINDDDDDDGIKQSLRIKEAVNSMNLDAAVNNNSNSNNDINNSLLLSRKVITNEESVEEEEEEEEEEERKINPIPLDEILAHLTANRQLQKNMATKLSYMADTNTLHDRDKITRDIMNIIIDAVQEGAALGNNDVKVDVGSLCNNNNNNNNNNNPKRYFNSNGRSIQPAELRRLRLDFMRTMERLNPSNSVSIGDMFIDYLESQLN